MSMVATACPPYSAALQARKSLPATVPPRTRPMQTTTINCATEAVSLFQQSESNGAPETPPMRASSLRNANAIRQLPAARPVVPVLSKRHSRPDTTPTWSSSPANSARSTTATGTIYSRSPSATRLAIEDLPQKRGTLSPYLASVSTPVGRSRLSLDSLRGRRANSKALHLAPPPRTRCSPRSSARPFPCPWPIFSVGDSSSVSIGSSSRSPSDPCHTPTAATRADQLTQKEFFALGKEIEDLRNKLSSACDLCHTPTAATRADQVTQKEVLALKKENEDLRNKLSSANVKMDCLQRHSGKLMGHLHRTVLRLHQVERQVANSTCLCSGCEKLRDTVSENMDEKGNQLLDGQDASDGGIDSSQRLGRDELNVWTESFSRSVSYP